VKAIGSQLREPIEDTCLSVFIKDHKRAILVDTETGIFEEWALNDHFSGYVVEINGKGYEFVSTLTPTIMRQRKALGVSL
jgi:hypothetical protein